LGAAGFRDLQSFTMGTAPSCPLARPVAARLEAPPGPPILPQGAGWPMGCWRGPGPDLSDPEAPDRGCRSARVSLRARDAAQPGPIEPARSTSLISTTPTSLNPTPADLRDGNTDAAIQRAIQEPTGQARRAVP
jgi:hypothetical protein